MVSRIDVKNTFPPHPQLRRVYVSTLYVGLDEIWPDFTALRAEGITIDTDYPFLGKPRDDYRALIERCDLFLAIYGFRSEGLEEQQENEYDTALSSGKPMLAFVHTLYTQNSDSRAVSDLLNSRQDERRRRRVFRFSSNEKLTKPVLSEVRRFFGEPDAGTAGPGPRPGPVELSPYVRDLLLQERDLAETIPANAPHPEGWTAQFNAVRTLARLLTEKGQIEEAAKVYYELLEASSLRRTYDKR